MDYKKIGLKCGLEIHQQLDTKKLFMNTPSLMRDDEPHHYVKRKLKAVVGEQGKKDTAAEFEEFADTEFIYQGYCDTNSPVEFDEEPPRVMDKNALSSVIQVSKILNCSIVDEVQIMRKIVIDGSNTSGFQRTCLVGRNGNLKTDFGNVGIPTISVEEDSAKIIERSQGQVIYNLSRLGIPLIEIGTDPDITSPEMAKSVAAKLGMILRSTGNVKRGLGTIRQDLNVSVSKGTRVEIKGAQDLRMIPKWVELEAYRQLKLIEIKSMLKKEKAKPSTIKTDVSDIFIKTSCKFISEGLKKDFTVLGVKLSNFSGYLGIEVQPGRRFGTELSDYVKKSSGLSGLIHSDEDMNKYSFSKEEVNAVNKKLKCLKNDAFVLVIGPKERCERALNSVIMRATIALQKIPSEVRRTNPDGTTSFMRPMPGSSRMYPETDCVPINTEPLLKNIIIPELIEEKSERFQEEFALSKDLADGISRFDFSRLSGFENFDSVVKSFSKTQPSFIAQCILNFPKELKSRFKINFIDDNYKEVFLLLQKINDSEITKEAFMEILPKIMKKEVVDYKQYKPIDDNEVFSKVKKIVDNNKGAPIGALMGLCMKEFRGKVDGKKLSEIIKDLTS